MEQPLYPTAQESAQVDLNALAKLTVKTFERLAPFSQLQTLAPSIEDTPIATKIVKKVSAYLQAIDTSILAVQIAHRLSNDAVALCNLAVGQDDQDSSFTLVSTESERRRRLDGLLKPAEDAHEKALKVKETFREAQQDLYKIAALTKDNISIIQIPVDPARPTTIQRSLKDVGSDLVANLGVVTDFSVHISHLAGWCGAIKADLVAGGLSSTLTQATDETDSFTHLQSIRTRWAAIKKSTWEYHNIVKELQIRYPDYLPASTVYWALANEGNTYQRPRKAHIARAFTLKAANIIRDSTLHLAYHTSFIGV